MRSRRALNQSILKLEKLGRASKKTQSVRCFLTAKRARIPCMPAGFPTRAAPDERTVVAMFEKVLFILAAMATVAGFALDVWREWKARAEDGGRKKK